MGAKAPISLEHIQSWRRGLLWPSTSCSDLRDDPHKVFVLVSPKSVWVSQDERLVLREFLEEMHFGFLLPIQGATVPNGPDTQRPVLHAASAARISGCQGVPLGDPQDVKVQEPCTC